MELPQLKYHVVAPGVSSIFDVEIFGHRDFAMAAKILNIKMGEVVVVDDGTISLRDLD